jgi:hypothetical protein
MFEITVIFRGTYDQYFSFEALVQANILGIGARGVSILLNG